MARFRLHSVTIEGFKAFTSTQTVDFAGRHAFIFGPNGHGKSSIVEAIRWCLFGLAERQEAEIRNTFYPSGECRVDLALEASDGIWHVVRRLRPGRRLSDSTISDPNGAEVPQAQAFPYLARMGPREGTHIIFAAQHAHGRRPQADISDFARVLYSYLRLDDAVALLNGTDALLEEQGAAKADLAELLETLESSIRQEQEQLKARLDGLLSSPPWDGPTPPTRAETDRAIGILVAQIAQLAGGSIDAHWDPMDALAHADMWSQVNCPDFVGDTSRT